MKTLHKSKYVEVEASLKSWGIDIDWDANEYTRPVYIQILCFSIQLGRDPWRGYDYE